MRGSSIDQDRRVYLALNGEGHQTDEVQGVLMFRQSDKTQFAQFRANVDSTPPLTIPEADGHETTSHRVWGSGLLYCNLQFNGSDCPQ